MNKKSPSKAAFINGRVLIAFVLCLLGLGFSLFAAGILPVASAAPRTPGKTTKPTAPSATIKMQGGASYKNDVSPPLREILMVPFALSAQCEEKENPKTGIFHLDRPDAAVQDPILSRMRLQAPSIPSPSLNFDSTAFPGVACNCAPNDPTGAVGLTQYVSEVNEAVQVFNKSNGASVMGPIAISTLWKGFGGVCEFNGHGDPVVLYDHFANRWLISQFAGTGVPTDECIAVSTSPDATGSYYRYGFHLGANYYDYPHIGVWSDAYYMSMNVFNSAGTAFLGPQPFAFDRANMLLGNPATFVSPVGPDPVSDVYLPADIDGQMLPPPGAPETFVTFPSDGLYHIWHFHVDFTTPANSTWTDFSDPAAAAFTALCSTCTGTNCSTRPCVPQLGVTTSTSGLDGIGDRMMFRLAYRNFGSHEALVTNYSVCATGAGTCDAAGTGSGTSGIRWVELWNVSNGPVTVNQESTYQPDTTWRWLGSAAMDNGGNLAIGFSASSSTINPQIRYAGRLATDAPNTLAQGEATLFAGTGSQSSTGNRWGDYSTLAIDPTDDCTFWYTNEYYATTSQFNWRTRVGSFSFTQCVPLTPTPTAAIAMSKTADAAAVNPGTTIGFTVTINSSGTDTANGLSFSDNLPSGPGINWSIASQTGLGGWSIAGSPPNQTLVYGNTSMAPSTSSSVHITSASSPALCGTTVNNSAMLSSSNAGSQTASASISFDCTNCTPNAWTDNSPQLAVPAPIMDQGLAALGTKIYQFTGVSGGGFSSATRIYDTVNNTWTTGVTYPSSVEGPVAVCDGTRYCFIMGGATVTTVRRYDTTGNAYATLTSFTTSRWAAGAVYFNGKIYLMGGNTSAANGTITSSMQIGTLSGSPPTVTWAAGAALPVAVAFPQVIQKTIGGVDYIYLTGGTGLAGDQNITYRYNIGTNTWANVNANMPSTRWSGASGIVNGFWVLSGGYVNGAPSTSTVTYDFNANSWTTNASSMVQPRGRGAGLAVGGSLYHMGGRNDGTFNGTTDNQKYTPSLCPPGLLSVVSRQTHGGGAGTFDLPLSTSTRVIEPRDGSGNFTIVFSFNEPVNSGTGTVSGGSVGSVNTSFSGNSMLVSLTGVNDQQALTITANNVSGPGEGTLPSVSTLTGFLIGDVNGDSTVNVGDTIQVRNAAGAVNSTNFQFDVNIDGQIDIGDTTVVRGKSGDFLP